MVLKTKLLSNTHISFVARKSEVRVVDVGMISEMTIPSQH
jgi:hypothetical protein